MAENNNGMDRGAVQDLLKVGRSQAGIIMDKGMNIPALVIPDGYKVVPLEPQVFNRHQPHPERIISNVNVFDVESFNEYFRLFSDPSSRVFAHRWRDSSSRINSKVLAILDYHGANGDEVPRWGDHKLQLCLEKSEEWASWDGADGVKMSQVDFAAFLENNSADIVSPTAASMLEVARDLNATTEGEFGSAIRLDNGSVRFKYSEQVRANVGAGNMEVPEKFMISIPLYLGGALLLLTCRLRYRINSGKLTFWYDIAGKEALELKGFRDVVASINSALGITIINGTVG